MSHDLVSSLSSLQPAAAALCVRDAQGMCRLAEPAEVLCAAQCLLAARVQGSEVLSSPSAARDFLRVRLGALAHEVFAMIHLDAQHRVLDYVELFRGTVGQAAVYPREVVKDALAHNASALVLVHCHPSGVPEPSAADQVLTHTLKQALALVDVRVLDHLIVAGDGVLSMAERGLL